MTRFRHYQNLVERILMILSEMDCCLGTTLNVLASASRPEKFRFFGGVGGSLNYDGRRNEASSCAQHSV